MGGGRRGPAFPASVEKRVRGTLSVDAEEAQPPPGRRPGRSPLAVTALVPAAVLGLAVHGTSGAIGYVAQ